MVDVEVEDGAVPVDLCTAKDRGIKDVYLTDLTSSLQEATSTSRSFSGSSTIVIDDSVISAFLPPEKCLVFTEQCLAYCKDTCLRTVTLQVDPTASDAIRLRVCNIDGACIDVDGTFWYEEEDTEVETLIKNTRTDRLRYFSATLPKGSYVAEFLDTNGNVVWPTFVKEKYEDALCPTALEDGSVVVTVPPVREAECKHLIRNGDAETSDSDHEYWLHRHGGISVVPGEGLDGSNAFGQLNSTRADQDAIAQFLDIRCLNLMRGRQYEVVAYVKLLNATSGENHWCSPSPESSCPELGIYRQSLEGSWRRDGLATVVAASSSDPSGYQRIHGVFDVTYEVASASSLFLYVRRHVEGATMFVDNVSMSLIPISDGECDNIVFNGDFVTGDSRLWFDGDDDALLVVSPELDEVRLRSCVLRRKHGAIYSYWMHANWCLVLCKGFFQAS